MSWATVIERSMTRRGRGMPTATRPVRRGSAPWGEAHALDKTEFRIPDWLIEIKVSGPTIAPHHQHNGSRKSRHRFRPQRDHRCRGDRRYPPKAQARHARPDSYQKQTG